ncbi:MAG: hypothetical protein JZU65_17910, partial [Chlorobium sp.]|nr:hypothetical protein [Chlorobium sp.]
NGQGVADAQYKAGRALVFLQEPDAALRAYAEDRGWRVLIFPPASDEWPNHFEQYPDIFGRSES